MFDLHTHIIPGIDDGATDLETSIVMLEIADLHGTSGLPLPACGGRGLTSRVGLDS